MVTTLKPPLRFDSLAAFEAWCQTRPEGDRYELQDGRVIAMAAERVAHGILKHQIGRQFSDQIETHGLPCTYLPDGVATDIDALTRFEPDGLVVCGDLGDLNRTSLTDAVIVVEVASPSTAARDVSVKLERYFRLPSLAHYLVVNAFGLGTDEKPVLVHYRRHETADGISPIVTVRHGGTVALDPPGLSLDLDRVFAAIA